MFSFPDFIQYESSVCNVETVKTRHLHGPFEHGIIQCVMVLLLGCYAAIQILINSSVSLSHLVVVIIFATNDLYIIQLLCQKLLIFLVFKMPVF